MIRSVLGVAIALALFGAAGGAEAQASGAEASTADKNCPDVLTTPSGARAFGQGALRSRECAVRLIEADGRTPGVQYETVRDHVAYLQAFYERRAARQQTYMDLASMVTIGGAAGASEGGLSASTRQAWIIAGVIPTVISRLNAYEPTRELFHGGALAAQLITIRYDRFNRALTMLSETRPIDCQPFDIALSRVLVGRAEAKATADRAARAALAVKVTPAGSARRNAEAASIAAAADAAAAVYDTDAVLLGEARRLRSHCADVRRRSERLSQAVVHARRLRSNLLATDYASDILLLDRALVAKDHDLRFTPLETLSAVVVSPLRALDTLISGEDSQAALDALKTQITFNGMNRSLTAISLPDLPAAESVIPVAPLSTAAVALDTATASTVLSRDLNDLRLATDVLAGLIASLEYEERWAREMFGAAAANHLTFAYDATNSTTTVAIGPAARPSAVASASTGTP